MVTVLIAVVVAGCQNRTEAGRGLEDFGTDGGKDSLFPAQLYPDSFSGYYSVSVQLLNCLYDSVSGKAYDMPLSLDIGGEQSETAQAVSIGSSDGVSGPSVLWVDDYSQSSPSPTASPVTKIGGAPGENDGGPISGFSTVPYWMGNPVVDGWPSDAPYPCASSVINDPNAQSSSGQPLLQHPGANQPCQSQGMVVDNTGTFDYEQRFSGTWVLYLPSETIVLDVLPKPIDQLVAAAFNPFAGYLPFKASYAWSEPTPVAATGVGVTRWQPGMLASVPTFTKPNSPGDPGDGPRHYVPTTCADMVRLRDGSNVYNSGRSGVGPVAWSSPFSDPQMGYSQPLDAVFAVDAEDVYTNPLGAGGSPVLLFLAAYMEPQQQEIGYAIPLESTTPPNSVMSQIAHTLQISIRNPGYAGDSCAPSTATSATVVGGMLDSIDLSNGQFGTVGTTPAFSIIANSKMRNANFASTNLTSAILAYDDTTGAQWGKAILDQSTMIGIDMSGAASNVPNWQGSSLYGVNLGKAILQANSDGVVGGVQLCKVTGGQKQYIYRNELITAPLLPGDADAACDTIEQKQQTVAGSNAKTDMPSGCQPATCIYVSIYNNSHVTLSQGAFSCASGHPMSTGGNPNPSTPPLQSTSESFVTPLETVQVSWATDVAKNDATAALDCELTLNNGADGKFRIAVQNNGGSDMSAPVGFAIDSGTCFDDSARGCYPPSYASSKTALVGSYPPLSAATFTGSNGATATYVDVIICEPDQAVSGVCPATAALPGIPYPSPASPSASAGGS